MQVLATAGLLLAAVAAIVLLKRNHPATTPEAALRSPPSATPPPTPAVPAEDLAAANLSVASAFVTPFRQVANDRTGKTLIGAYADATRTVLFFRAPNPGPTAAPASGSFATISVYDSHGFLNGGTTGGRGIAADSFFALDLGPRLDQDGLAHVTVTDTFPQEPFTAPPPSTGWAFRFTLKVQTSTLLPAPATFQLGRWTVTIEDLATTPSVIDFQAVIAGANNQQLFDNMRSQPVMLLDAAGTEVRPITAVAGVTGPKQQLNATTHQNTPVPYQWAPPSTPPRHRPPTSGGRPAPTVTLPVPGPL